MKRIAVASKGSSISETILGAEGFRIYEFDGTTIHAVDYFDQEDLNRADLAETFKSLEVEAFFAGSIETEWAEKFDATGIEVVTALSGEIADAVVGYYLEEILENKKRGMKPLSSCHH